MEQVGEACWLGGLPVRKGLGPGGLWGSQQSFIRWGGDGGVQLEGGPTPYPFYIPFLTEKQGSRSSHILLVLVINFIRGRVIWTLAHWAGKLQKLFAQQETPLVPGYWTRFFFEPWKWYPF